MLMFALRRILKMSVLLVVINFLAFSYAHYGRFVQLENNPIFARQENPDSVLPVYLAYAKNIVTGQPISAPAMAGVNILDVISAETKASLGLLAIAFSISLLLGIIIGVRAVNTDPPRVSLWLIPVSTMSLAMPGFYIGALLITFSVFYLLYIPGTQTALPFPLGGFGWDKHLVFPVIALSFRPMAQIAQTVATLLSEEFFRPHITAARSFGHSWRLIKFKTAMRNIYVPLAQVVASSFSLMIGELILVEWLFRWPGLGRQLALSIRPPNIATIASASLPSSYLHAPTVATVITVLSALLLISNILAGVFTYSVDPRLRDHTEKPGNV